MAVIGVPPPGVIERAMANKGGMGSAEAHFCETKRLTKMSIEVDESSKLSKALKLHADVLDYIVSLNPRDFKRLYNPLMRRLMPPRISLARVAHMTGTPVMEMLTRIHEIAGCPLTAMERKELGTRLKDGRAGKLPSNPGTAPEWIRQEIAVVVDLLMSDVRLDADPLPPIMKSLKSLRAGEVMLVKHAWEPQPLYDIWNKQGVDYYCEQKSAKEWWIYLRWRVQEK